MLRGFDAVSFQNATSCCILHSFALGEFDLYSEGTLSSIQRVLRRSLLVPIVVGAASLCLGGETFTLSGPYDSNGPAGDPSNGSAIHSSVGGYSVGSVVFSGDLTSTGAGSYL